MANIVDLLVVGCLYGVGKLTFPTISVPVRMLSDSVVSELFYVKIRPRGGWARDKPKLNNLSHSFPYAKVFPAFTQVFLGYLQVFVVFCQWSVSPV